jgi:uncharacterized membrane protein YgcG
MRKLCFAILLLAALPLSAKSLSWSEMRVTAHLDADGRLAVRELQTMVFDGDWNGGERKLRLSGRQGVDVTRVARIENGQEIVLTAGDTDQVDHYIINDGAIRWRSRLASDPPFENRSITYAIDYTLDRILISLGGNRYKLDHDFCFADREGVIRNYSLELTTDPAWSGIASPLRITRETVVPGDGVIVRQELTRTAGGVPASVWMGPSPGFRNLLQAALIGALILLAFLFYRGELPSGRFAPLVPVEEIDRPWLEANILTQRPEVIGAAWDDTIGAPEVAAVLARLTAAGKIRSHVEDKVLHLELVVDKGSFGPDDRHLIDKLFFSTDKTDTDKIRAHYKSSGFDPSETIKAGIESQLARLPGWKDKVKRPGIGLDLLLLGIAAALMVYAASVGDQTDTGLLARTTFFSLFFGVFAIVTAVVGSGTVTRHWRAAFWLALPMFPILANAFSALRSSDYGLWPLVGVTAATLAVANFVLHMLRTTQSPDRITYRQRLVSARTYFKRELASANPSLQDGWLPYILAFGLGRNVDRWFRAHGDSHNRGFATTSSSSSSSGSSSIASSSWSGGGGAFGGAGATGAWAVAAGAMAAGVSAPSSSSSGGGSSSGGSSSGGGGGGGW